MKYAIGRNCIYLGAEVLAYFLIVIIIDFMQQDIRTRQFLQRYVYREPLIDNSEGAESKKFNAIMMRRKRDENVLAEEDRVREQAMIEGGTQNTSVFVKNVSKLFYVPQPAAMRKKKAAKSAGSAPSGS